MDGFETGEKDFRKKFRRGQIRGPKDGILNLASVF